ncbi:myo-inositol-1-phosphate synthase [Saccharopolyspora erythraea NRRL 2338]|uniref:Myo-inositol phosphate synthase n=2 Tax=Saccharopolyspora erythraea TaxID=1836 RepID=A4FDZ5_SACEN|nr:inositol-3-phosphate synthase [Saccharopolyspora erythraea]PFG96000.1 myo-inositol-1-phosphate synthase [Saccharopolyspora erythraea NRRL 2338]QRK92558.1 inositol-3-phosphate synthase [Saccharopolyspora erythraea]CAM02270.1 putative myo-inositol phosphate synthase [Saccharopolyspora erythraea NRRL 2338]
MTDTSHRHVPSPGRTGLWLFGARGSVATTAIAGLAALRAGVADATGCVTELPGLREAPLPAWGDIVVGGHDISDAPLHKSAEQLAEAGVLPTRVLGAVAPQLSDVESELRTGYDPMSCGGSQAAAVRQLSSDIVSFRRRNRLRRVVAINVASTEAPAPDSPEQHDLAALEERLDDERPRLPAGVVNTCAALSAGCPYVEFTPSPGIGWASLRQLAERLGLPFAGCDGKTGETLLRSVLAPMFAERGLSVLSWSGTNLLGGGDGATLADPVTAAGKLESKSRGLAELLGPGVSAPLHIDHVADLGQTKIAWDNVHARGFLGAPVTLQLTWTGYDSALAAPLVLDLTRLVAMAHHAGQRGALGALGCFFKDPLGDSGHRFDHQVRRLREWVRDTAADLEGRES